MNDWSDDRLLGGSVVLRQFRRGYRAGVDPVLLAACVPAHAGDRVLDLGTGVGAVALCLLARVPGASVRGIECDAAAVELARLNAAANGVADNFSIDHAAVENAVLPRDGFDHVAANPPYHDAATHRPSPHAAKARAHTEAAGALARWIAVAFDALRSGGTLSLIHRADRLGDVLAGVGGRAGAITVLPVQPTADAPATRVVVQAIKGRKTPLRLLPPLALHEADGRSAPAAEHVLRDAVPFPLHR